jgi:hypothetical protein
MTIPVAERTTAACSGSDNTLVISTILLCSLDSQTAISIIPKRTEQQVQASGFNWSLKPAAQRKVATEKKPGNIKIKNIKIPVSVSMMLKRTKFIQLRLLQQTLEDGGATGDDGIALVVWVDIVEIIQASQEHLCYTYALSGASCLSQMGKETP